MSEIFYSYKTRERLGDITQKKPYGTGGAGSVYPHPSDRDSCIKIYTADRIDLKKARQKVASMISRSPDTVRDRSTGTVQMTWPIDMVEDSSGQFRGFVMPFINFKQEAWSLSSMIQQKSRAFKKIPEALQLRVAVARNIAALVESVHAVGHQIVDLKPANIFVYNDNLPHRHGFAAMLDCDGFRIVGDNNTVFPAELGTPEFSLPGSIDYLNSNAQDQDLWALAIIVFQLLNNGIHPVTGIDKNKNSYPDSIPERIEKCLEVYPYGVSGNPRVNPAGHSIHWSMKNELRDIFDRVFLSRKGFPSASEWRKILSDVSSPANKCQKNPDHWLLGDKCGLCEVEKTIKQSISKPAFSSISQVAVSLKNRGNTSTAPSQPLYSVVSTVASQGFGKSIGIGAFLFFAITSIWWTVAAGALTIHQFWLTRGVGEVRWPG